MVYYALIALIPLLLLVLATIGLLLRFSSIAAGAEQQVLEAIEARFGPELQASLIHMLDRLRDQSLVVTLVSLGGLFATSAMLVGHLRMSFRAIWRYKPPVISGSLRKVILATLREKIISFTIVTLGEALLFAALILITALEWFNLTFSHAPLLGYATGWLVAVPSGLLLVPLSFALLFMFLPPTPLHWRQVWLAAALCAVAWWVAVEFLALYAVYFGNNVTAYGAFGGLLVIMLWLKVVSQVLFFGAELCKVVARPELQSMSWGGEEPIRDSFVSKM